MTDGTAGWMHLDADERARAMPTVGRHMFGVSSAEIIAAASSHRLSSLYQSERGNVFSRGTVRWDILMLERHTA